MLPFWCGIFIMHLHFHTQTLFGISFKKFNGNTNISASAEQICTYFMHFENGAL